MKLNGHARKDFESWFKKDIELTVKEDLTKNADILYFSIKDFYKFPDCLQWGVYQNWFDSVLINFTITPNYPSNGETSYMIIRHYCISDDVIMTEMTTGSDGSMWLKIEIDEAYLKAIKYCGEAYNSRQV